MKRNRYTVAVTSIGINHPTQYLLVQQASSLFFYLHTSLSPITVTLNLPRMFISGKLIQLYSLKKAHFCNDTNANDRVDGVKMTKDSEQNAMAKLTPPDAARSFVC